MADIYKGELQDNLGNTVYPHTESDVVFCTDGETVQEKLAGYDNVIGNVIGTSGSLEVNDANILATTEATKQLDEKFGGLRFGTDGDGNVGYYGADGSLIPFSSGDIIVFYGYSPSCYDSQNSVINTVLVKDELFSYDSENRRIICNKKGTYSFIISFSNVNTNSSQMILYKNGNIMETFYIDGLTSTLIKTYTVDLEANDYVYIYKGGSGNGVPTSWLIYEDN